MEIQPQSQSTTNISIDGKDKDISIKQNIIDYNNQINDKFLKNPNLKYKLDYKFASVFEVFTSCTDNKD